jgi:rod shape-determining protein MreD
MRTALIVALVACVGLLLQSTTFQLLPFEHAVPDVLLVVNVYLALHFHSVGGVVGAFLLGYAQDTGSGSPAGLNACGMLVVFVLVYLTCRRLWVDNVVSKVVLVFLASLVKTVVVVSLLALFTSAAAAWRSLPLVLLSHAVLASLVAPPVFWILSSSGVRSNRDAE